MKKRNGYLREKLIFPFLISRTYLDGTDPYTGFYYQDGHHIYRIQWNIVYFVSVASAINRYLLS